MNQTRIQLPSETLPASGSGEINLAELTGQPLVVYFYPRDNTPGCTREGQDFRDHHEKFDKLGCRIVGVSRDTLSSHEKFAAKHEFPFPLVADQDEILCRHFDVIKEKNMYGRKVMGIERSTFLFDADGNLVNEWRKVKVPGHVEEVLEAVRELD